MSHLPPTPAPTVILWGLTLLWFVYEEDLSLQIGKAGRKPGIMVLLGQQAGTLGLVLSCHKNPLKSESDPQSLL